MADARTIVVVGSNLLMQSDDASASWTEYALGTEDRPRFVEGVAFADDTTGFAVGSSLGEGGTDPTSPRPLLFATRDGGATWVRATTGVPGADRSHAMRDVCLTRHGIVLSAGFAFSGDLVLISRDSGVEWRSVATDPALFTNPSGVACLDSGDLWIAGARPGEVSALGSLLRSTDSGETWAVRSGSLPDNTPALAEVAFSDAANGIVVGEDAILSTTNGGATWEREAHPYASAGTHLVAIAAATSRYLVGGTRPSSDGRAGVVLVRIEGEPGWVEGELPPGTDAISGIALAP